MNIFKKMNDILRPNILKKKINLSNIFLFMSFIGYAHKLELAKKGPTIFRISYSKFFTFSSRILCDKYSIFIELLCI